MEEIVRYTLTAFVGFMVGSLTYEVIKFIYSYIKRIRN